MITGCEILAGAALFACLARDPACLPDEHRHLRDDLAAIAEQESGHNPRAIRDERTGESLFPATLAEAVRIATERDALGHVVGLGLMQITHRSNWQGHGLTIAAALDGCRSLRAGAAHYAGNLQETQWEDALAQIGEMYFSIKIPSQSNPMFDMMSSMLMGGNNPFAAKKREQKTVGSSATPPAPGLD